MLKNSEILSFLSRLSENNSKVWMDANRAEYHLVRDSFRAWVQERLKELAKFDPDMEGLELKQIVYRINKNTRFQKDAPPYKDYLAVSFSKEGKKSKFAEYYCQIRPNGQSLIGGGSWGSESADLAKIRQEIDYNPEPLLKILKSKKFKDFYGGLYEGYKLKTAPRGYSQDHENIELLRLKHHFVFHEFEDSELDHKDFNKTIIKACKIVQPLVKYINNALS